MMAAGRLAGETLTVAASEVLTVAAGRLASEAVMVAAGRLVRWWQPGG